jgi:hypothetical protein
MKVSNEELAELVTVLSSIMAGMLEMNATIAKAIIPSSTHLNANEKHNLMVYLENLPAVTGRLKEICDQLKTQLQESKPADNPEEEANKTVEDDLFSTKTYPSLKTKAESGNAEAQTELGHFFYCEGSTKAHEVESAKWFLKAAEQGFAEAQYSIGLSFANGTGVSEDNDKALFWLKKTADQGLPDAQSEYGRFLQFINFEEALKFYRESAEQGHAHSQAQLAYLYSEGERVPKNDVEAFKWYLRTAQSAKTRNDYISHFVEVGRRYLFGEGTSKNINEAVKWLLKTADPRVTIDPSNLVRSQFFLGLAYSDLDFEHRDLVEAYAWLNLAMDYKSGFDSDDYTDFWQQLSTKQAELARLTSHEQGEAANRRAAELFVPWNDLNMTVIELERELTS